MGVGGGRQRGNGTAALLLAAVRLLAVRLRGGVDVYGSGALGGRSAVGVGGGRRSWIKRIMDPRRSGRTLLR